MPELRRDPVHGRWVIIADERGRRPSDFETPRSVVVPRPCPFCEGQEAATPPPVLSLGPDGSRVEAGWQVRVFPNLYPALRTDLPPARDGDALRERLAGFGAHEVIVESPRHDATLATLPPSELALVLRAFRDRLAAHRGDRRLLHGLVFQNHLAAAGATLAHPHAQLVALPLVPELPARVLELSERHHAGTGRCLLCDLAARERADGARVVADGAWLAFCPWASSRPYETWLVPAAHRARYEELPDAELDALAAALGDVLRRFDAALDRPAWNLMLHTLPLQAPPSDAFHLRLELVPAVTRVAGFEWGTGCFINPTAPEEAARSLREVVP